jgi:hypothetical protein
MGTLPVGERILLGVVGALAALIGVPFGFGCIGCAFGCDGSTATCGGALPFGACVGDPRAILFCGM